MKTLRLGLLAIFLVATAMAYTVNDDGNRYRRCVKISLHDAYSSRGLIKAIYEQVDESFIGGAAFRKEYTVNVKYQDKMYLVYGKYQEWINFFLRDNIQDMDVRVDRNDK